MSNWLIAPNDYKEANDCGCPTRYWKAFLMDYVTLPLYNRFFNAIISAPLLLGNIITFGNFLGGSILTHDAVIIYFKCSKCGSKFPCTFDLVDTGSRYRFGYFKTTLLGKYHQTKLWLTRDEMQSVLNNFTFGPEKYHSAFYNCSHFANQFYNAICKLDEKSCSYKWSKILGLSVLPLCYKNSDCFVRENTCFCSSENWKTYQMDLNTVMIFDESKNVGFLGMGAFTADINVLTLYFECSECQKEFKTVFYYYKKICRKNGQFCRILTTKKSIHVELSHDSLKPILDNFALADIPYTSKKYARDLFNAICEASAEQEAFETDDSPVF